MVGLKYDHTQNGEPRDIAGEEEEEREEEEEEEEEKAFILSHLEAQLSFCSLLNIQR